MTENRQKTPKNDSIGDVIVNFCITFFWLLVPTIAMWIYAMFYCIGGCSLSSVNAELNQFGANLGSWIPIIGIISAIVMSSFVVYILKMRATFREVS